MTEVAWLNGTDPKPMLEFLDGKLSDRKARLFAVACCRRAWHLLVDQRSRQAVEVAERFADGLATDQELVDASTDAWQFTLHLVHDDQAYSHLDNNTLNAADIPAFAAEEVVAPLRVITAAQRALGVPEGEAQAEVLRCIFGNPFRHVAIDATWRYWEAGTIGKIAQGIYDDRAFERLPILADALEEAGCTNTHLLQHCRSEGLHSWGCWPVDLLLEKS